MPRGIKGSGKPRKVFDLGTGDAPVKKTRKPRQARSGPKSVFGEHGKFIKQMKAQADLAKILEKHLLALSVDLARFDSQNDSAFGSNVVDKVIQASVDALLKLDFTTVSKTHKSAGGFFDEHEPLKQQKTVAES
jgi:hypothetical protein